MLNTWHHSGLELKKQYTNVVQYGERACDSTVATLPVAVSRFYHLTSALDSKRPHLGTNRKLYVCTSPRKQQSQICSQVGRNGLAWMVVHPICTNQELHPNNAVSSTRLLVQNPSVCFVCCKLCPSSKIRNMFVLPGLLACQFCHGNPTLVKVYYFGHLLVKNDTSSSN